MMGFEPDAVMIDDADKSNGYGKQAGNNGGDPVESAIWRRVKDLVAADSVKPLLFVHGALLGIKATTV
jgi:hypothetical protein